MSIHEMDDDDEEEWIPLVPEDNDQNDTRERSSARRLDESPERAAYSIPNQNYGRTYSNENKQKPEPNFYPRQRTPMTEAAKLERIQNKLQDRISIQTHLVDRPLDYFWQRCLINLLRQMYTLEVRIQLGILMLATGLLMRVFLWSTWYLLYPRFAILSSVFVASILYLDPLDMQDQLRGTWNMIEVLLSQSEQRQVVEGLDAHKLRRLSLVLFMIPLVLEIRTLSFLSRINAGLVLTKALEANDSAWSTVSLYCYNIGVAICILSVMLFLRRRRRMKPCDVSYRGLLTLYGFSLLVTVFRYETSVTNARQIPALAAPFLTATATLLLMYEDDSYEWLSRITRQAFRFSLRDVLSMVSERVTDDDMLQLAILRWICDFWASSAAPTETKVPPTSSASSKTSFQSGSKQQDKPAASDNANPSPPPATSSAAVPFRHNSVKWEELQPMLNIEIDHMETEIDALRTETAYSNPSHEAGNDGKNSNQNIPTTFHPENDNPLMGLKSMLLSFDVDERAQPAVLAFRRAVESFPPKKKTAVTLSILRRCPALLTIMIHTLFLSDVHSVFITSLILSPFVLIEYYRISEWMETCQRVKSKSSESIGREEEQDDWRIPLSLRNVDTMTILLSGDENTVIRPPSLLIVWYNIVSSVSALEVGLSTARCVETTAVAIEFAGSAMSLVKFGFEISERGLLHGVMVLAGEVLSIYGNGRDIGNLDDTDRNTAQYTSAAVGAVRHGQKIVKNIQTISGDQNVLSFAQPFMNFLFMLTRGKEEETDGDVSTSPGTDHELHLDENESGNKNDNVVSDDIKDNEVKIESKNEGEKVSKTVGISELESMSDKTEDKNVEISKNCDSTSKSPAPEEDLAQVMEMIAESYEQGLIDQTEKDDFFKKLSALQKEELHDASVLFAMKRTLTIILENGSMIPIEDDLGSSSDSQRQFQDTSVDPKLFEEIATNESDTSWAYASQTEEVGASEKQRRETRGSQTTDENNDIVTLGVAALGLVASGLALAMNGDSEKPENQQEVIPTEKSAENQQIKRERTPSVEIVELTDENTEDEWVSLID